MQLANNILKEIWNKLEKKKKKKNPTWHESASELYRPSDRRMSAKLVQNFTDRTCQVVSLTDSYGRILGFLDHSLYL
jgi:hypothetical protein